eukprot:3936759-Rhodomonas_salina.1
MGTATPYIVLRLRYAISGTDAAYHPTRKPRLVSTAVCAYARARGRGLPKCLVRCADGDEARTVLYEPQVASPIVLRDVWSWDSHWRDEVRVRYGDRLCPVLGSAKFGTEKGCALASLQRGKRDQIFLDGITQVSPASCLRAAYAMPGTDAADLLRAAYALPGTDAAPYAMRHTMPAHGSVLAYPVPASYAVSGTAIIVSARRVLGDVWL